MALRWAVNTGLFLTLAFLASCGVRPSPAPVPTATKASAEAQVSPRPLPTPSLPDLAVNSVSVEWNVGGDCADFDNVMFTVQVEIRNRGSGPAGPFEVAIGGSPTKSITESANEGLEPGESMSLEVTVLPSKEGGAGLDRQVMIVTVDSLDEVRESDEVNNAWRSRPELPVTVRLCFAPEPFLTADLGPIPLLPPGQPLNFRWIDMIDASRGWGIVGEGEQDQHIVLTEDGGRTWIDVSPPELAYGEECGNQAIVETVDARTAWVGNMTGADDPSDPSCNRATVTDLGNPRAPVTDLWKTEDGGRTWRLGSFVQRNRDTIGGNGGPGFPILEFVDSQHGWALRDFFLGAGSSGVELYRTIDGGKTWELLPEGYLHQFTGMDFLDLKHGWVTKSYPVGYYPQLSLAQTHDGGSSWESSEVPLPGASEDYYECAVRSPSMRSSTTGQIIMECSTNDFEPRWYVYETSDGGRTWKIRPIPEQPDQFVSASVGWRREYAHTEEETDPDTQPWDLFWTDDGGQSWSKVATVTLLWGGNFDFVSAQIGWAVGKVSETENALLQTLDGGRSWKPMQPVIVERPVPIERSQPPRITTPAELQVLTSQTVGDLELLQAVPVDGITSLAVYTPYHLLLSGHQDGTGTLWDLTGAHYARVVRLHSDWIYDISVAEVPGLFATASKDGRLKFWAFYGYIELNALSALGGEVASVAYAVTDSGQVFAAGGQDSVIRIWEPPGVSIFDGLNPPVEVTEELLGHTAWVWDLALAPDGRTLASASADRTIRLWDIALGELLDTLTAHNATVGTLAFSPNGSRLASAAWDGSVVLWDSATWQPLRVSGEHSTRVYTVSFSPDGSLFATGAANGDLILWSAESGEPLRTVQVGKGAVRAVLFTPDGRLLITGSDDGFLRLWGVRP